MRAGATLEHMSGSVAVVLHLVPDALEEGRLAGEAELVETGARALFTSADDLVAFVTGHRAINDAPRSDGP